MQYIPDFTTSAPKNCSILFPFAHFIVRSSTFQFIVKIFFGKHILFKFLPKGFPKKTQIFQKNTFQNFRNLSELLSRTFKIEKRNGKNTIKLKGFSHFRNGRKIIFSPFYKVVKNGICAMRGGDTRRRQRRQQARRPAPLRESARPPIAFTRRQPQRAYFFKK